MATENLSNNLATDNTSFDHIIKTVITESALEGVSRPKLKDTVHCKDKIKIFDE